MEKTRRIVLCGLGIGLVAMAAAALVLLRASRPVPRTVGAVSAVPRVETLTVSPVVFEAPIVGYGTVRAKRQVKIVPEVGGRLTDVHPDFAVGNLIPKGELLFEIEPRVYESKVEQVRAEISRLEAQLKRHRQDQQSFQQRLALAERMEALSKKAVTRESGLITQQSGTAPELELAEQRNLGHQDAVLTYRSQLELIPLQIEETDALLDTKRAQLEEAMLNVEKTRIFCPFDARVDAITAQESQVVIASFQIATLTDMEALEVPVVIDPRELRWTDQEAFASAIGGDLASAPEARVSWTLHGHQFSWSGRITRLEKLDEVTRSAHVVVEVGDIMKNLEITKGNSRPPLSVGMFCRAELPTEPLTDALVIPRTALRDGDTVYVFEPDPLDPSFGRLSLKHVPVLRHSGENVLVSFAGFAETPAPPTPSAAEPGDLLPGDEIIVSALPKAVEGMRLARRTDSDAVAVRALAAAIPSSDFRLPISPMVLGSVTGVR